MLLYRGKEEGAAYLLVAGSPLAGEERRGALRGGAGLSVAVGGSTTEPAL